MTIFDLLVTPNAVNIRLISNTGLSIAAPIGSGQTVDRQGYKWKYSLVFNRQEKSDRATLMATLVSLRGQSNRLRLPMHDNPAQGAYGGTPVVDTAGQTGNTLNIRGLSNNVTGWGIAGDYFSVIVNGEPEIKMIRAGITVDSDGGGLAMLTFEPKLRESPVDGAAIYVDDGVLPKPQGIFLLENAENGWSSTPHRLQDNARAGQISDVQIDCIEDVFATQQ